MAFLRGERMSKTNRHFPTGVNYRSVCARCNNVLLGARYDPELIAFTRTVDQVVRDRVSAPPAQTCWDRSPATRSHPAQKSTWVVLDSKSVRYLASWARRGSVMLGTPEGGHVQGKPEMGQLGGLSTLLYQQARPLEQLVERDHFWPLKVSTENLKAGELLAIHSMLRHELLEVATDQH